MLAMSRDINVQIITATTVENLQKKINMWLKGYSDTIFDIKYSDSGSSQTARGAACSSFSAMIVHGKRSAV